MGKVSNHYRFSGKKCIRRRPYILYRVGYFLSFDHYPMLWTLHIILQHQISSLLIYLFVGLGNLRLETPTFFQASQIFQTNLLIFISSFLIAGMCFRWFQLSTQFRKWQRNVIFEFPKNSLGLSFENSIGHHCPFGIFIKGIRYELTAWTN